MKSMVLLCLVLVVAIMPAIALEPGDVFLGIPVFAKTLLPLALVPPMFGDADTILPGVLAISVLSVPNAVLAYNILSGNPAGTSRWRKIVRLTDGAAFAAVAGYGAYVLADSSAAEFSDIVGTLMIAASIPLGISFALDFIPYAVETGQ
jgi:hypothetical protein